MNKKTSARLFFIPAIIWIGIAFLNLSQNNVELLDIIVAIIAIIAAIASLYRARIEANNK